MRRLVVSIYKPLLSVVISLRSMSLRSTSLQSVNNKSRLQEYIQKRHSNLFPLYVSSRIGGTDDCPKWTCRAEIVWEGKKLVVNGAVTDRKISAEQSAAELLLSKIIEASNEAKLSSKVDFPTHEATLIVVDEENKPQFIAELSRAYVCKNNVCVTAFCSSSRAQLLDKYADGVVKVIAHSTRSDSADIAMVMFIGGLLMVRPRPYFIFIVTGDHFGETLADIVREGMMSNGCPMIETFEKIHVVGDVGGITRTIERYQSK